MKLIMCGVSCMYATIMKKEGSRREISHGTNHCKFFHIKEILELNIKME